MELSQQEKVEHFVKFTGKSEKLAREVLIGDNATYIIGEPPSTYI